MDLRHCRLRDKQQDRLAEFFVAGVTARTAAELLGIHRNSAAYFYHRLREIIAKQLEKDSPLAGQIEVDESYFGGHRKGWHGRGAAGKVPVFGLLKRGGRVYTAIIPDTKRTTLMPIIQGKIVPIQWSIPIVTGSMTFSMSPNFIISALITPMPMWKRDTTTLMVSKTSGARQRGIYATRTASLKPTSTSSSKNASGGSTTARQLSS